jgi:peroxiredoxin
MKRMIGALPAFALALFVVGTSVRADDPVVKKTDDPVVKKDAPVDTPKKDEVKVAELGKPAPDFELKGMDGKTVKLADYKGKIVVLEWFNPGCPYCQAAYDEKGALRTLPEKLMKDGVVWISINSQGSDEGSNTVDDQKAFFKERGGLHTPLLFDPTGKVGHSYGAKSTPHCFVIDAKGNLAYRGALDNAPGGRLKEGATLTNWVEAAVGELKAGKPVTKTETKSYG